MTPRELVNQTDSPVTTGDDIDAVALWPRQSTRSFPTRPRWSMGRARFDPESIEGTTMRSPAMTGDGSRLPERPSSHQTRSPVPAS